MIVAAYRSPVLKGHEKEFENKSMIRPKLADMTPGFIRNELLKPLKGQYYIVLSYWETLEDFEAWTKSEGYQKTQARKGMRDLLSGPIELELHEVIGVSERVLEMKD